LTNNSLRNRIKTARKRSLIITLPNESSMNKKSQDFLPYVFPLIAIVFVVIMFARWYQGKTAEAPKSLLDSQLEIGSLSAEQQNSLIKGTADYKMLEMTGEAGNYGELRYQVADNKFVFTVTANMSDDEAEYSVWMVSLDGKVSKRIVNLSPSKAGLLGSAAVSIEVLPVKIVLAKSADSTLDQPILSVNVPASDAL